jgi:SAM-dependent methyltransferase
MRLESKSQFYQDFFVWSITGGKTTGCFLDVGAGTGQLPPRENDPGFFSNTYFLEWYSGWTGIAIDYDKRWCDFIRTKRNAKILCEDLMQRNINEILEEANCPTEIDYLSFDVDDAQEKVFEELDFEKYKFKIITYEHNLFQSYPNCDQNHTEEHKAKVVKRHKLDRDKFMSLGYKPIWENVGEFIDRPVEDWYLNEEMFEKFKHLHKKTVSTRSSDFKEQLMELGESSQ